MSRPERRKLIMINFEKFAVVDRNKFNRLKAAVESFSAATVYEIAKEIVEEQHER